MRLLSVQSFRRLCSDSGAGRFLKIGGVRVPVATPKRPELVPRGYADLNAPQETLAHLRWLCQKDILKQDTFLIGPPGPLRQHVVLQYLELMGREYEYLAVTRDTTEADIKQRRDIRGGTATYTDLCAVRAALEGRVLVIDGVEKAERNVLPILNNLLENREMQLDDGRFLMHPQTYDKLAEKHSSAALSKMGLCRVSEAFRVIALGLPVPRFPGYSLDPPLRSRFQARHVKPLGFQAMTSACASLAPRVDPDRIASLASLMYALNASDELKLPHAPIEGMRKAMRVWNTNPTLPVSSIFSLLYPRHTALTENELEVVGEFMHKFDVVESPVAGAEMWWVERAGEGRRTATVQVKQDDGETVEFQSPSGDFSASASRPFVPVEGHSRLLADLAVANSQGDWGLLGPKGGGKTTLVEELAARLGYTTETMVLYQDMNSRELLQRRRLAEGDTVWEDSQLVAAAKHGGMCVLDGVERMHWSALDVLSQLIHHRRLHLPDGSRLVGEEEHTRIEEQTGMTRQQLEERGVYRIPASFRVVLVGDSAAKAADGHRWMNEPVMALLPWVTMKPLSVSEQCRVISELAPSSDGKTVRTLVQLVDRLAGSHDAGLRGVALSLSLRKLVHMSKRDALHGGQLRSLVEQAALSRFLPAITRTAFSTALDEAGIADKEGGEGDVSSDLAHLREERMAAAAAAGGGSGSTAEEESMVPDVLFYDNQQHSSVLADMARDLRLHQHLLLIGNQGVGKNKVTDRFLHLINRPRQYMQLHRDTTVESLTTRTTVEDGRIKHEDSALVRAARLGHVLVVDEADKAPLHVIAVLKSLLDTGTLLLSDGRRIQPSGQPTTDRTITLHPHFKMIMLANRPGFPFLGNDLFGVLGDLFSVHTLDNPTRESEMDMLRKYGPNVPPSTLSQLVSAFSELRQLADEAVLQYPYSTRELVNVVRHVNEFPGDPLPSVVRNVFDFDEYSADTVATIQEVFQKHGIPLGVERPSVYLAKRYQLPPMKELGEWGARNGVAPTVLRAETEGLRVQDSFPYNPATHPLSNQSSRTKQFSEEFGTWHIPLADVNIVSDAIVQGDRCAVATANPLGVHVIHDLNKGDTAEEIDLSGVIRRPRGGTFNPRLKLAAADANKLWLHEETTNTLLLLDPSTRVLQKIALESSLMERVGKLLGDSSSWRLIACRPDCLPVLLERGGEMMMIMEGEGEDMRMTSVSLPHPVRDTIPVGGDRWIVSWQDGSAASLLCCEGGEWEVRPIENSLPETLHLKTSRKMGEGSLFTADGFYALKSDGFPATLTSSPLLGSARPELQEGEAVDGKKPFYAVKKDTLWAQDPHRSVVSMGEGILVRATPNWDTPQHAMPENTGVSKVGAFLEAVDTRLGYVQYVPVPPPRSQLCHAAWVAGVSATPFVMAPWTDSKLVTVDTTGTIRAFELTPSSLGQSFAEWKNMFGEGFDGPLRMEYEKNKEDFDIDKLDEPKMGKVDPDNTPHVGGNQWFGGTGGYNTAGLGGVGGSFRFDAGHDVHQMPDEAKQQVPEHILKRAREVAKAEFKKKLREIEMSEHDAHQYGLLWERVRKESGHMQNVIEQLEARNKERLWARHQTSGDLDDGKLIEGVTGEKNIYRRRIEKPPEPGAPQTKPKRLRMVFDVSGSMYRFNGYDKRLQRSLEAALMVMTSLEGKGAKVKYDLTGHSGDGPSNMFINTEHQPKDDKERLEVLKKMLAHTQYCQSGDFTPEALDFAIKTLSKEQDVDERIVILISDANLERYGIRPRDLVKVMNADEGVNAFIILIGSLGEQAERLQKALPVGKAFVCKDTADLPHIMQNIFASTLI